ncbi:MAG: hypothetical protein OSA77_13035, partial [Halioglobus sp.]|nr:hypothetical protein [Halioglobus sp.]
PVDPNDENSYKTRKGEAGAQRHIWLLTYSWVKFHDGLTPLFSLATLTLACAYIDKAKAALGVGPSI